MVRVSFLIRGGFGMGLKLKYEWLIGEIGEFVGFVMDGEV